LEPWSWATALAGLLDLWDYDTRHADHEIPPWCESPKKSGSRENASRGSLCAAPDGTYNENVVSILADDLLRIAMGIRFYCPQGHKLNVKSFLAGKKGFCPHCNAKVDIPLRSTRPSSKEDKQKTVQSAMVVPVSGPAAAGSTTADAPLARPVTAPTQGAPLARPISPHGGGTAAAVAAPIASGATAPASPVGPTNGPAIATTSTPHVPTRTTTPPSATTVAPQPSSPATSPSAADPIAEAPHAVWYVRPVLGGQYGPASGDMLRQWIGQGRVAADSLVWREGWPHWQPAGTVLPQTANPATSSGMPDATNLGLPMPLDPLPVSARSNLGRTHRKRSNLMVTLIVVLLVIIALGLAGVLIAMLR